MQALRPLTLLVLFLGVQFGSLAQGPPIFSDTPVMLGLEGRGLRTFGNIIVNENGHAYVHPVAIPYNITSKWQIGAVAPFVSKSPDEVPANRGFGDLRLFTKWQLYQKNGPGRTFRGLLKLSETFPTGDDAEMPALGSGNFQTAISMVNGFVTTQYGIYWELGYNFSGDGLPNKSFYNLAFGYPLLPQEYPPRQLNLFLELNGAYVFDQVGNQLFLSPGVQFIAGRRVLFESGVQVPLDQNAPKGAQVKYIWRNGIRILLF